MNEFSSPQNFTVNTPSISVVIPTCHRNDLLAKCLDGLTPEAQGLAAAEYEVIVTDDGSKTTAEKVIKEKYPWATWVAGPRQGPAANRNHGAEQASGQWIVFTDDDCIPQPGMLKVYLSAITPEFEVYEGKTTCQAGVTSPLETAPTNLHGGFLWSCNMMIRREVFLTLRGFDTGFPAACNEDVEFRERLKRQGYEFVFVPDAVVDHPPRAQVKGLALAKRGESEVRLWYATRNTTPSDFRLVVYTIKVRIRQALSYGFSVHSLIWLGAATIEIAYVLWHLRRWNFKHRRAYPNPLPSKATASSR